MCLPKPKAKRKTILKVKCLFKGLKGSLCDLVLHQGNIPGGDAPPTFGSVSLETIQEMGEILTFADINGQISQCMGGALKTT